MRSHSMLTAMTAACVLACAAALPAVAGRKTRTATSVLAGDARLHVAGRIVVRRQEATTKLPAHESWELRLTKVVPGETYSLWMDSPVDATNELIRIPPWTFSGARNRTARVRFDDATDELPFGVTLAELAGLRVQVRNAANETALAGTVPALH